MSITRFFWNRQDCIERFVRAFAADVLMWQGKRIVDVGAGHEPWEHASELVDIPTGLIPQTDRRAIRMVDVDEEPLPFADKSVDFAYCRHTIEDLNNPMLVLREMGRVASKGYVETPSPLNEFTRGVAGDAHRGYVHHRWFAWVEDDTLILLPKYPITYLIESSAESESRCQALLSYNPILWNTYYFWTGSPKYKVLRHMRDFDLSDGKTYAECIQRGVTASVAAAVAMSSQGVLQDVDYT
jgi:SAM-dependent methyltransferase